MFVWNDTTEALVFGPKLPSTAPGSVTNCVPKNWEWPFRHVCRRRTAVA
jgi:hypothetical protein